MTKLLVGGKDEAASFADGLDGLTKDEGQLQGWVDLSQDLQKMLLNGWGVDAVQKIATADAVTYTLVLRKSGMKKEQS